MPCTGLLYVMFAFLHTEIQGGIAEISQDCHMELSKAVNINFSLPCLGPACEAAFLSIFNVLFINLVPFHAYVELESVPLVALVSGCLIVPEDIGMKM